jgi:hypothetical protein
VTHATDPIVVISWWSNCLGLACLESLVNCAPGRRIIVVQTGKSAEQKRRFTELLPRGVEEFDYPEGRSGAHCKVLSYIIHEQLRTTDGAWFFDHDLFLHTPVSDWLDTVAEGARAAGRHLCLPRGTRAASITEPAFWIRPTAIPNLSFDPVPFLDHACFSRPDTHRFDGEMAVPVKDTMMEVRDALASEGRVAYFPMRAGAAEAESPSPFPRHMHLGGLSLFAGPILPKDSIPWMRDTVDRFARFFDSCPPRWLEAEDAVLRQRHAEFAVITRQPRDPYAFENYPRAELSIAIPRRQALLTTVTEARVREGQSAGGEAMRIASLGTLPDELIALFTPRPIDGCVFSRQDGFVVATVGPRADPIKVCPASLPAAGVLARFDGRTMLESIARALASEQGWDDALALRYVRGVFLHAISLGVCWPK